MFSLGFAGLICGMKELIYAGTILLCFSLLLAWLLSSLKGMPGGPLAKIFKSEKALLQCHIDYVFMAILLFIFALTKVDYPLWLVYVTIAGATTNPLLFLVMAIHPEVRKTPTSPFGMASVVSFVLITTGMAGSAILWAQGVG